MTEVSYQPQMLVKDCCCKRCHEGNCLCVDYEEMLDMILLSISAIWHWKHNSNNLLCISVHQTGRSASEGCWRDNSSSLTSSIMQSYSNLPNYGQLWFAINIRIKKLSATSQWNTTVFTNMIGLKRELFTISGNELNWTGYFWWQHFL